MFTKSAFEEEDEEEEDVKKKREHEEQMLHLLRPLRPPVARSHGGMTRLHQFSLMTPAVPLNAHRRLISSLQHHDSTIYAAASTPGTWARTSFVGQVSICLCQG